MATFHNEATGVTITVTPEHPSFVSISRDPAWQDTAVKDTPTAKRVTKKKSTDG